MAAQPWGAAPRPGRCGTALAAWHPRRGDCLGSASRGTSVLVWGGLVVWSGWWWGRAAVDWPLARWGGVHGDGRLGGLGGRLLHRRFGRRRAGGCLGLGVDAGHGGHD